MLCVGCFIPGAVLDVCQEATALGFWSHSAFSASHQQECNDQLQVAVINGTLRVGSGGLSPQLSAIVNCRSTVEFSLLTT